MNYTDRITDILKDISQEAWAKYPVMITDNMEEVWGDELFGQEALKSIFTDARIPEGCFRIVKEGALLAHKHYSRPVIVGETIVSRVLDGSKAVTSLNEGNSVILSALEEYWKPVRTLCSTLGKRLGTKCAAFAVITPPGRTGFVPHIDRTEQLVIQCSGEKKWKVFDVQARGKGGVPVNLEDLGVPVLETLLKKGQMLYLPQGAPHMASSSESLSIHITITFEPVTMGQWITLAVKEIISEDDDLVKDVKPFWFEDEEVQLQLLKAKCESIASKIALRAEVKAKDLILKNKMNTNNDSYKTISSTVNGG